MGRCLPISQTLTLTLSNGRRIGIGRNKNPNWAELPEDLWVIILSKLTTFDVMVNAHKVCRLFQKICMRPSMYRIIDIEIPDAFRKLRFNIIFMTRRAVDRSAGQLLDIYLRDHFHLDILYYIVMRSPNLRCLRFGGYFNLEDALVNAVRRAPALEELEFVVFYPLSRRTIEALGRRLPKLSSLSVAYFGHESKIHDEEAIAIAQNMPNLRRLQLISSHITNQGLAAILNGCPNLESLSNIVSPSHRRVSYNHLLRVFRSCEAAHLLQSKPCYDKKDPSYFTRFKLWLQK